MDEERQNRRPLLSVNHRPYIIVRHYDGTGADKIGTWQAGKHTGHQFAAELPPAIVHVEDIVVFLAQLTAGLIDDTFYFLRAGGSAAQHPDAVDIENFIQ